MKTEKKPVASNDVINPSAVRTSESMVYRKDKIESITGISTDSLEPQTLLIASMFAKYMEDMKSNVMVTEAAGANHQLELYHALNRLYGYHGDGFKELYKWVLKAVSKNRRELGAFCDKYVMRYHSWMNLSVNELKQYRSLLSLLLVTADLKLKSEVTKRVDVQAIIDEITDKTAKDNLLNFYFN